MSAHENFDCRSGDDKEAILVINNNQNDPQSSIFYNKNFKDENIKSPKNDYLTKSD